MRKLRTCLPLCAMMSLVASLALLRAPEARACGCFAPPDPSTPVVQTGEKILFAIKDGQVTAEIQIQYQGDAKDFGWLLPLPSVPVLELGSDEVFTALFAGTTPAYRVKYILPDKGCGTHQSLDSMEPSSASPDLGAAGGGPGDPLVLQANIGPYDYAVLKADSKTDLLAWLAANHYLVPAGTDAALGPYLHPGAYFLALKLKPGQSAGDLQPVVVHYASDLPMIPLILTSATARDDMGVWTFVLGGARAIPRNYYHVVLDDAAFYWDGLPPDYQGATNGSLPSNYEAVLSRAVQESKGHHAFMTEYAGPASPVRSAVFPANQFGSLDELRKLSGAAAYLGYLRDNNYRFSSLLVSILQRYIKQPPGLKPQFGGLGTSPSPANYYYNFDYWFQANTAAFQGFDLSFDPVALTGEIEMKIVMPVKAAAALFDSFPYLTRLHTRLNQADMSLDPVFSFNPSLPDVSNQHLATMQLTCDAAMLHFYEYNGLLRTEQGFVMAYPGLSHPDFWPPLLGTLRLEILREAGAPELVNDYQATIATAIGPPPQPMSKSGSSCSFAPHARLDGRDALGLLSMAGALLLVRRRRRLRG